MKIKQLLFILIAMPLMLTTCIAKNKPDPPYLKGLNSFSDGNSLFLQIINMQNHSKFDQTKIQLYGYINKLDSRIYLSPDFDDSLLRDDSFRKSVSILLYDNHKKQTLLNINKCKANDSLVEIHGVFHVHKPASGEVSFYLTDIESIYDFDTRPKNQGGAGEKYQCYPVTIE